MLNTVGPQPLISSAQNLTGAWADLGGEIGTSGVRFFGLWLNVDINDANNPRIRLLAKHTESHADEFSLPIHTVGTSDVKVEDEYLELNVDADQKLMVSWELDRLVPFVQVQVMAGVAGATPGQIDAALVTMGY